LVAESSSKTAAMSDLNGVLMRLYFCTPELRSGDVVSFEISSEQSSGVFIAPEQSSGVFIAPEQSSGVLIAPEQSSGVLIRPGTEFRGTRT